MSTPPPGSPKSTPKGRRIAARPARSETGGPGRIRPGIKPLKRPSKDQEGTPSSAPSSDATARRRAGAVLAAALTLVVLAVTALCSAAAGLGPDWLDAAGAIVVAVVLTGALVHRTGGRPLVAPTLVLAFGLAAVLLDVTVLRSGAAVLTVVVGGVYAVMATVPAISFLRAAREALFATVVAGVAALAAVGFEPTVTQPAFDNVSLLLSLVVVFGVVYRLGAGIHGLGRRGLIAVLVGVVVLVLTLAYAELLRRYGAGQVIGRVVDVVEWSRDHLGAFPRPLAVLLGIPALLWGCFQRARRRQGWWACAFGVTATVPLAQGLLDPGGSFLEAGLRAAYSLLLGMLLGYVVVRLDLALTAPRGRRGRRAEEADAHRPEPPRFAEL